MRTPYFKFFVSDYLGDTQQLDIIDHGIYLRLLMLQWQDGSVPGDMQKILKVLGIPEEFRRKMSSYCSRIDAVLANFFTKTDERNWQNIRMSLTRENAEKLSEFNRHAGLKGVQARKSLANAQASGQPNAQASGQVSLNRTLKPCHSPDAITAVRARTQDVEVDRGREAPSRRRRRELGAGGGLETPPLQQLEMFTSTNKESKSQSEIDVEAAEAAWLQGVLDREANPPASSLRSSPLTVPSKVLPPKAAPSPRPAPKAAPAPRTSSGTT